MTPFHINARCPRCTVRALTQISQSAVRCDGCGERYSTYSLAADCRQMLAALAEGEKAWLGGVQEKRHAANAAN